MKISSSDNITDIEIVDSKGTIITKEIPKSIDEELYEWLLRRNIDTTFYVEDDAKEMVLQALQDPDFESAYIDEENVLVVEFKE
jgi:pyrimidine operon attenuation protein/uracil phosphoribosyltransferase